MAVNLLQNGDFGGGTHSFWEWGNEMTATQVPDGWEFWYRGRAETDPVSGAWHRPEARVLRTQEAGKPPPPLYNLFTSHSTHCWALWQKVASIPGWPVYFTVNAWPWSSNGDVWPNDDGSGSYWVRVGIDPQGGDDPHAASIVWSHGTAEQVDNPGSGPQWVKGNEQASLFIEAQAEGETATVFVMGFHEWPMKHGTCLLWDAEAWQDKDSEYPDDLAEAVILLKAQVEGQAKAIQALQNIVNRLGHVSGFDRDFAVWLPWFLPKTYQTPDPVVEAVVGSGAFLETVLSNPPFGERPQTIEEAEQLARMAQIEDAGKGEEWKAVIDAARKAKSKTSEVT